MGAFNIFNFILLELILKNKNKKSSYETDKIVYLNFQNKKFCYVQDATYFSTSMFSHLPYKLSSYLNEKL